MLLTQACYRVLLHLNHLKMMNHLMSYLMSCLSYLSYLMSYWSCLSYLMSCLMNLLMMNRLMSYLKNHHWIW